MTDEKKYEIFRVPIEMTEEEYRKNFRSFTEGFIAGYLENYETESGEKIKGLEFSREKCKEHKIYVKIILED